jgi:hypothetical protein
MPGNNCNLIVKSFEDKRLDFYNLFIFFYAMLKLKLIIYIYILEYYQDERINN